MRKQKKPSEIIRDFLDLLETSHEQYFESLKKVEEYDKNTYTYVHDLEASPDKSARNKLATKWQRERKERRKHKDVLVVYEDIHKFATDEMNKPAIKRLRAALKAQIAHEDYVARGDDREYKSGKKVP